MHTFERKVIIVITIIHNNNNNNNKGALTKYCASNDYGRILHCLLTW